MSTRWTVSSIVTVAFAVGYWAGDGQSTLQGQAGRATGFAAVSSAIGSLDVTGPYDVVTVRPGGPFDLRVGESGLVPRRALGRARHQRRPGAESVPCRGWSGRSAEVPTACERESGVPGRQAHVLSAEIAYVRMVRIVLYHRKVVFAACAARRV